MSLHNLVSDSSVNLFLLQFVNENSFAALWFICPTKDNQQASLMIAEKTSTRFTWRYMLTSSFIALAQKAHMMKVQNQVSILEVD